MWEMFQYSSVSQKPRCHGRSVSLIWQQTNVPVWRQNSSLCVTEENHADTSRDMKPGKVKMSLRTLLYPGSPPGVSVFFRHVTKFRKKKNLTSLKTFWEKWNQNQCRHVHCKFRNKMRKWIAEQSTSTTGMNLLMWHNEFWEVPGSSVNRILIKGVETWLKNSMNKTKEKKNKTKTPQHLFWSSYSHQLITEYFII